MCKIRRTLINVREEKAFLFLKVNKYAFNHLFPEKRFEFGRDEVFLLILSNHFFTPESLHKN